jgi:signal transduction histidine kinase
MQVRRAAGRGRGDRWRELERDLREIGGALDHDEVLTRVRHALVPELADVLVMDVRGERRVEAVDPQLADEARPLLRAKPVEFDYPQLIDTGTEAHLLGLVGDREARRALRQIGCTTALLLPLGARARRLGTLMLIQTGNRSHDSDDLALAWSLAQAAGQALDNARLFAEARAATRARDEQLSMVAHDLRNPLIAMRMEAEKLEADRIARLSTTLLQMVSQLLDLTSFDTGRARLTVEPADPVALVREALDAFGPVAEAEGVAIEVRAAEALPRVRCDRGRIWQVLSNLLGNAILHGQGGRVTVSLAGQHDEVRFTVADAGCGIAAEKLAGLFEGAHGLGLQICRRIIEAHGGWIWAENEGGAAFHFTLPAE